MPGPPGSSNYRTSQTLFCPFLAAAPQHVGAADTGPGKAPFLRRTPSPCWTGAMRHPETHRVGQLSCFDLGTAIGTLSRQKHGRISIRPGLYQKRTSLLKNPFVSFFDPRSEAESAVIGCFESG
jgi:hypothetical protein